MRVRAWNSMTWDISPYPRKIILTNHPLHTRSCSMISSRIRWLRRRTGEPLWGFWMDPRLLTRETALSCKESSSVSTWDSLGPGNEFGSGKTARKVLRSRRVKRASQSPREIQLTMSNWTRRLCRIWGSRVHMALLSHHPGSEVSKYFTALKLDPTLTLGKQRQPQTRSGPSKVASSSRKDYTLKLLYVLARLGSRGGEMLRAPMKAVAVPNNTQTQIHLAPKRSLMPQTHSGNRQNSLKQRKLVKPWQTPEFSSQTRGSVMRKPEPSLLPQRPTSRRKTTVMPYGISARQGDSTRHSL